MIPTVLFMVVLIIVLVISYRRTGTMSGRNVLYAIIGFLGWFLINTLLWAWIRRNESGTEFINPARFLPMLVTILALVSNPALDLFGHPVCDSGQCNRNAARSTSH